MKPSNLVSEFIGVFTLCFIGILAIHNLGAVPGGLLGIALAHGLAIGIMVSALGAVSGGHFNPAVSLGLLIAKKIDGGTFASYVVAQILGGAAAAGAAAALVGGDIAANGVPKLGTDIGMVAGIGLEAIATFFLMLTVFGTAVDGRAPKVGGLFIGLVIAIGIIAIGPLTGGALNPARHLGPAIVGGGLQDALIYIAGPCLGAALAAVAYTSMFEEKNAKS